MPFGGEYVGKLIGDVSTPDLEKLLHGQCGTGNRASSSSARARSWMIGAGRPRRTPRGPGRVTAYQLIARWKSRQDEWRRLGASVSGEAVASEIIGDLEAHATSRDEELLTPRQAATQCGYHVESIGRLIRSGRLANHGTARRPLVKASELPRRAPAQATLAKRPPTRVVSAPSATDAIARDVIAGRIGR